MEGYRGVHGATMDARELGGQDSVLDQVTSGAAVLDLIVSESNELRLILLS